MGIIEEIKIRIIDYSDTELIKELKILKLDKRKNTIKFIILISKLRENADFNKCEKVKWNESILEQFNLSKSKLHSFFRIKEQLMDPYPYMFDDDRVSISHLVHLSGEKVENKQEVYKEIIENNWSLPEFRDHLILRGCIDDKTSRKYPILKLSKTTISINSLPEIKSRKQLSRGYYLIETVNGDLYLQSSKFSKMKTNETPKPLKQPKSNNAIDWLLLTKSLK